jgi:hypothetical protein
MAMLSKHIFAVLALISMVELASATETVSCKAVTTELAPHNDLSVPCQAKADPSQVTGMKILYGDVDQADMLLMRISDRGAPLPTVVAIILFLPGVAILFFSWLVKSSK